VIQNGGGVPHPIHIHGHDFSVLGAAASSTFSASSVSSLNFVNPPRRDVAMLPGTGWLVIGFQTNNPGKWLPFNMELNTPSYLSHLGAWLMHCHIVSLSIEGVELLLT
jgi:FtsP/CotA-like multicopper oxidase with cupredoxin domain